MKRGLRNVLVFLGLFLAIGLTQEMSAQAFTKGSLGNNGYLYDENGQKVVNDFVFDGQYTYYAQADSTPMTNRLTYHPDGEHIIYFDSWGHEVFNEFQYCASVGYTCYFDSNGYLYKDQITFYEDKVYYLNGNGAMEEDGWFQFANGIDYGFANYDGSLVNDGFGYDPYGRVVFYHWNGMVARGLISDGYWYYNMDLSDGHYAGRFRVTPEPADAYSVQRQVLDLVNDERLIRNLVPLYLHQQAEVAAQVRAVEISSLFSHTRPSGATCFTALTAAGVDYRTAGENIAAGHMSPQEVVTAWMNSPGHRANILDPDFKALGVGYYYNTNTMYRTHWVQLFIG